jgi:D-amino-acid oxidase
MKVLVIGAGISGLTAAIRLREAGHDVSLRAASFPPHTTSDVAAAVWYPYRAEPVHRVLGWAGRAYEIFLDEARDPQTGVVLCTAIQVFSQPAPDPWWRSCVRDFRRARRDELPPWADGGYAFTTAVVETSRYLPWLLARLGRMGVPLHRAELASLDDALATGAEAIVNCTGLGAARLVGDASLFPIRGEVLKVATPSGARVAFNDDAPDGMAYVVPRSSDCVLGGTAVVGEWSLAPDPAEADGILRRCERLVAGVRGARVLGHAVGLRPGRPEVRLEREELSGRIVVHDYGHGGAGVTLSWGCADEVVALLA